MVRNSPSVRAQVAEMANEILADEAAVGAEEVAASLESRRSCVSSARKGVDID